MSKLHIVIDMESNDLEEIDFEVFLREAKLATAINVEVGRPVSGDTDTEDSHVARMFQISAENFTAQVEH